MMRKYSLNEIDQMREALQKVVSVPSQSRLPGDPSAEEMLRTYMLAGVDPEEIYAKGEAANKATLGYFQYYEDIRTGRRDRSGNVMTALIEDKA